MNTHDSIAVTSRSFCKNSLLRKKLLSKYKHVKFNDEALSMKNDDLQKFLKGCTKAITSMEIIDEKLLENLPKLKVISKYGVGLDMIDFDAIKKFNIKLRVPKGINKRSVAELVVSYSILLIHGAVIANSELKNGDWKNYKGRELTGKRVGILGCGEIGKEVINLLKPYNCIIKVFDEIDQRIFCKINNVIQTSLHDILQNSDIITIHLPLNSNTKNLISNKEFKLFNKKSYLINLSRGGVVNEKALIEAIKKDNINGAAIDVFESEPTENYELLKLPNVFATPHIAGTSEESTLAMGLNAIENLDK